MNYTDPKQRMQLPAEEDPAARTGDGRKRARNSAWWREVRRWHWISAAISLVGILLFAVTGITLNHAAEISASPTTIERQAVMPPELQAAWQEAPTEGEAPLPQPWRDWLDETLSVSVGNRPGEWSPIDVYVALPRPGGDAWLSIDRETGEAFYERTDRGWISYLNDLHKGRDTGTAWRWFIDIFAGACVVFSVTGLLLLQFHARNRPSTWPLVGLGFGIPVLLAILFIH